jgi:hypothetical protein
MCFAGPPTVLQAAVWTVRLGHRVRQLPKAIFVNINAGEKFSTRDPAFQHHHSHGLPPMFATMVVAISKKDILFGFPN